MPAIRCLCVCCLLAFVGCTSTKTSNTARTGTEQLLISNAVDQALAKVDFSPMAGRKVLVEEKYLDSVDKSYIISSIRHNVLHAGGHLTVKPDEADIILELRSGGVGTDTSDAFLGVPGISLPGMLTLPDLKLVTRTRQSAFAKLGIVAIDAKTQQEMPAGGVALAMSDDNNWYVMGVGPYRQGTMEQEVELSIGAGSTAMDNVLPGAVAFKKKPRAAHTTPDGLPIASRRKNLRDPSRNYATARPITKEPAEEETTGRIQLTSGDEELPANAPAATQPSPPQVEHAAPAGKSLFE